MSQEEEQKPTEEEQKPKEEEQKQSEEEEEKQEVDPLTLPLDDINRYYSIKGDLEKLRGIVISHYPIALFDEDKEKLKKKYIPKEMFKEFEKKYMKDFKFPTDLTDEFRPPYANSYYGGVDFTDAGTTSLLRGMGWELVKEIGKKILQGDFNFTTVTIPIKVMTPISVLQHICNGHFNYPLYLNLAAREKDPVIQMKYVIIAMISCWHRSNVFLKPLNPILGETYEMIWEDGSIEYVEQTSHHPPRSHFLLNGVNGDWRYYGYYDFTSNAWLNSFKLTNSGKRTIEFKNTNAKINFNYPIDQYGNTFWGSFRQECIGELELNDVNNNITAKFGMGNIYGKTSDWFEGTICKGEEEVSKFTGSYLEYIEFDGERCWDIRKNIDIEEYPIVPQIKSSSIYREDSKFLYQSKLEEAQKAKDDQENLQRHDRKLRKEYEEQNKKSEEEES